MITVQRIETFWTKESRGMPASRKRNAVPRVLQLPATDLGKVTVHEIKASEETDFELSDHVFAIDDPLKYWSFSFHESKEMFSVSFDYSELLHGKPDRGRYRESLFSLKPGQVGSFHINGRFASYSGQWYIQQFVNYAYGRFEPDVFLTRKPDVFVNEMANLF